MAEVDSRRQRDSDADRGRSAARGRALVARLVAICLIIQTATIIVLIVGFFQLNAVGRETHKLAQAGAKARQTQIRLFPITCRIYRRLEAHGLIRAHELAQYLKAAPARCP